MFCLNWKIYTKLTWLKITWPGSSTIFWKFWRFWDLTSFWELTPNNCLVRNLSGLFILFTRKSDQRAPEHRIISRRFKFCLNQSFQFFPNEPFFAQPASVVYILAETKNFSSRKNSDSIQHSIVDCLGW